MNKEEVDSYFINKTYLRKIGKTEVNKSNKKYTKKDYKKYKKDVYRIIKEIMNGSQEHNILKESMDHLIGEIIDYIKFKKVTDLVQKDHEGLDKEKSSKPKKEFLKDTLLTKVEEGNLAMLKQMNPKTTRVDDKLGVIRHKKKSKAELIIPQQKLIEKKVAFLPEIV